MIHTAALLLSVVSPPAPTDITPASLAVRPRVVDLADGPYDWKAQARRTSGQPRADTTIERTCCTDTNINGTPDQVPDYGFD